MRARSENLWLKGPAWLLPESCTCGEPMVVCWTAWRGPDPGWQWATMCDTCDRKNVQAVNANHYALIYEVGHARVRPVGERQGHRVHIWMRGSSTVESDLLVTVIESFANLERARFTYANTPRSKWALEVRGGEMWAPWNPYTGTRKDGPSLPFRKSKLRPVKWGDRECVSCKAEVGDGSTVWRPKERPSTKEDRCVSWRKDGNVCTWEGRAMRHVMVCSKCVAEARVVEAADPGVMVGHLRVLDGEAG